MAVSQTPDSRAQVPTLDPGLTALEVDTPSGLCRIVAKTLQTARGPAYWVDAASAASTRTLFDVTDDRLALERLRIARAFTGYQHAQLISTLPDRLGPDTSLLVCSGFPRFYDDDELGEAGDALFHSSLRTVLELAHSLATPVVLTHASQTSAAFSDCIDTCADTTMQCSTTDAGLRFEGPNFETNSYRTGWTTQTTLSGWTHSAAEPGHHTPARHADADGSQPSHREDRQPGRVPAPPVEGIES